MEAIKGGNPPLSFRDVLMQVQHKGSCYLEISEPESEGFESDEWEEEESLSLSLQLESFRNEILRRRGPWEAHHSSN